MHVFPDALAEKLSGKIITNNTVSDLQQKKDSLSITIESNGKKSQEDFDNVVLSVPAQQLSRILMNMSSEEAKTFSEIEYPPVTVVFMGFKIKDVARKLDGFGFLVPKVENRKILGTIWSSTIFPDRAPEGYAAFTTFVGGVRQPEITELDDDELSKVVIHELEDLIGLKEGPNFTRIKKWPKAIPQYTMGYGKIQKMYNELEERIPGLYFAGNFRRGIGIGDSVLSAHETSQKMINR
jgi:oxygen-dependent protoporphyrinogen oxidase